MFASSNSSHSTPRSGPSDHAPLPSFVVTSSNDTPYRQASTPVKSSAGGGALNPEAREFRITPSFGGSLFAMPASSAAAAALPPPRWTATAPTPSDFSARRAMGSPHGSPPPVPPSTIAESLDGARLIELTEAYMHEVYGPRCRDEGLHMVAVFHLHPRTTNRQLSSIFFPTGASAAEVLEPHQMPEPLANAFNVVRQRAGVVFFTCKDFAMVGVEKINDFVPHGQHQPLVVRYCGPDAQSRPPPPRSHSGSGDAATVPSPPTSRPTPPRANFRDASSPRDLFPATAAVPQGPSHFDPRTVGTAADSAAAASATSAVSPANTYDVIDQHFLQKYAGEKVFLVGVHNLAYGTSPKSFYKMFYPMGALNSELLPRPVSVDGKLRCSGVAIFNSKGMAIEAAEKINDFVPHGQRRPVVARFLERPATPPALLDVGAIAAAADRREAQRAVPVATASTPRAHAAAAAATSPTTGAAVTSAAALLASIQSQLRAKTVSDAQLAADMAALVLCHDSGEAEAKRLADLLRDTLQSMGDHSTILSSPLSGALRVVHNTLGVRTRTAPLTPADASAAVKKAVMFLQLIGRTFMMLVADTAAARQTRMVAAVQCAYLYQYTYLPRTPLSFATALFQNCSRELRDAKAFLCRDAEVPTSLSEERLHRPWVTLMDALQEMVQVWRSLDPRTYAQDGARDEYERFVSDFRGADMRTGSPMRTAGGPAMVPSTDACTPRNDALEVGLEAAVNSGSGSGSGSGNGATSSAKKSQLVTPSARPTPRRVVSKSYSTTSDWKGKQSTPVTGAAGAVPPQVMLSSPASDYTQGASEFSVESSAAGALNSALRSMGGVTPQHPTMRFAWGSRVAGTTPQPPAPATATTPAFAAPSSAASASGEQRSDAAMTECTVYITKLPSCFTSAQVRRLLLHFGDFRKVRLCHDDKETTRGGSAEALAAHHLKFHDLCFGFVEFAEPASARAMVEFFRNEVHTPTAFDFLRTAGDVAFDEGELSMLRSTRTSQARNPIHDQQPIDAARGQPCLFGVLRPEHTIETYADVVTADEVAAAVAAMHAEDPSTAPALPPPQSQPSDTTAVVSGEEAVVSALQPMDDVFFPRNFPYHYVFAGAADEAQGGGHVGRFDDDDDAPVLVEEDDDDGGLQEYQVQQILELLN